MFQNKCNRFYLGTHTFTPTAAANVKMDNVDPRSECWIEMVRLKIDLLKCLKVMTDENHVKQFAGWLEEMYLAGRSIIYR